ncbi:MAG TPA: hypothetical protein VNM43_00235 [Dehalococcoidia bacterium]|nr:hypothetical protein [Dehalococcoidia bacterium]
MSRRKAGARDAANFYAGVLDRAERARLEDAAAIEGLDDEVALLRVRLRTAIEQRPEDYALMLKGIALLVRAVAARYRLSPKSRRDLAESLAATIEQIGAALFPGSAEDEP